MGEGMARVQAARNASRASDALRAVVTLVGVDSGDWRAAEGLAVVDGRDWLADGGSVIVEEWVEIRDKSVYISKWQKIVQDFSAADMHHNSLSFFVRISHHLFSAFAVGLIWI
jgi:hypothetical protein